VIDKKDYLYCKRFNSKIALTMDLKNVIFKGAIVGNNHKGFITVCIAIT